MWWKTRLALRLAFLTHRATVPSEFGASIAATPIIDCDRARPSTRFETSATPVPGRS